MKAKNIILALITLLATAAFTDAGPAKRNNAYGQKHYTVESAHFRIHYHRGLEHLTPRVASKLEELYQIYSDTYRIVLPQKTDVVLYESEIPDAFAYPYFNFIYIGVHDYEFNLRGSSDWFDDVLTHEYAHVVSMWTGMKFAPAIPSLQFGYFTHPNETARFEGLHVFPSDIMPVWFIEGIAQYESSRRGADRWDSHRDMIMRTLTLSGKTLTWPHMQVFAGKGDDFEKTYNHGFSLVMYIADTYGYDKIVSILRENARVGRLSFDGSVKAVLGISAKQLYNDWQEALDRKYKAQMKTVGEQVFGRKINKAGYDNLYPMFSPDGKKIYFVSNDESDYSLRDLYSYNLSPAVDEKKKIKYEMPIRSDFDIHAPSGKIAFVSMKSRKSVQDPKMGGQRTFDLFIEELPPDKPKFFSKNTQKQVTEKRSVHAAAFSPAGDKLVCAVRKFDRFFIAITDTSGKNMRIVYPKAGPADEFYKSTALPEGSETASFNTIFSLSWSPNGKDIAIDYIDGKNRKIGVYDTLQGTFSVINNTDDHDQRNPSFNKDGSMLYFSSDQSGIFNVYRYIFKSGKLERMTNVSGGAFYPAVCGDNKKLVYSGYDKDGYGIYLIDTMKAIKSTQIAADEAVAARPDREIPAYSTPLSNRLKYSALPRQWLFVPTLIGAQRITTNDQNEDRSATHVMGGLVVNFMDPLAWANVGNEGGAFLLVDLARIFDFIDLDAGLISPYASYEAGVFLTSKMLPVTIDAEVMVIGAAGKDWFYEESEGAMMPLSYKDQLTNVLLGASYPLYPGIWGQVFAGHDRYDVAIDLSEEGLSVFTYNLSKGYRVGAMTWFAAQARNSRANISPKGLAAKLQYNFWQQHSLKEENSFTIETSTPKERYDDYLFHRVDGRMLLGMGSPVYPKHDIHLSLGGSYIKPTGDNRDIPSFYLPIARVPGYAVYYRDEKEKYDELGQVTDVIKYDTMVVTGKAVLAGELSYRFPLWPGRIDKKLGFLYFDRLYGALNFNAGAGFDSPTDALDFERDDWLFAYGAEMRLEAISFNSYPLALKFRWDYGADRSSPQIADNREITLGGHRFAFSLGFSFDDWHLIPMVDYFTPSRFRDHPGRRFGK